MNVRFLETFIWVAQLRSFKAAAVKCNLTQAAISGRIAALEEEFNQPLFERKARSVHLTQAGRMLLPYAQQMVEASKSMLHLMHDELPLRRRLRLGVIESITHSWFPELMQGLERELPDAQIEITTESARRLHQLMRNGEVDIALQADPIVEEGMYNRELGAMRMGWICLASSDVPGRMSLSELTSWPIITFPRDSQPYMSLLHIMEKNGVWPHNMHFVSSIGASRKLLEQGIGIATLPLACARPFIESGDYRLIQCDHALADMPLIASWRPDHAMKLGAAILAIAREAMQAHAADRDDLVVLPEHDVRLA